ncbi:MAG: hypothetical protein ACREP3_11220 [Candidatus Binatia bacterium]
MSAIIHLCLAGNLTVPSAKKLDFRELLENLFGWRKFSIMTYARRRTSASDDFNASMKASPASHVPHLFGAAFIVNVLGLGLRA